MGRMKDMTTNFEIVEKQQGIFYKKNSGRLEL
jgi:hypothetical protein